MKPIRSLNLRSLAVAIAVTVVAVNLAALAEAGRSQRKKARTWVGRPAAELVAVMGAPDRERELKHGRLLIWHRVANAYVDPETGFGARHIEDAGSPPIPGDPTRLPPGILECSVRVSAGGVIQRVNLPEGCALPERSDDDSKAPPKPELPHSDGTARDP